MRKEEDIIKNFNRRVRNNEAVAKRVFKLNKPRKTAQSPTINNPRV